MSPLLANVYLHYALDLWTQQWRRRHARGEMIIVRYADDFVVGFQNGRDAARYRHALEERLRKFSLELHPDKTRLIEFGRYAVERRSKRGLGKPETFDFRFRVACVDAMYRLYGDYKMPPSGKVQLSESDFVPAAEFDPDLHCVAP